jgi:hypothetical protein
VTTPEIAPQAAEAERQLAAAADRHREVLKSLDWPGDRAPTREHIAAKSVVRGVQLVAFALRRAADAGVPFERLSELTGWEPDVVQEALDHPDQATLVHRLTPAGVDPGAVGQAAASLEATARVQALARRIFDDLEDDSWSPAPADLDELKDRLETAWRAWRQALGRTTAP